MLGSSPPKDQDILKLEFYFSSWGWVLRDDSFDQLLEPERDTETVGFDGFTFVLVKACWDTCDRDYDALSSGDGVRHFCFV
jgi:hypothetical protein